MPDVTPRLGLPFPLLADTADVPRDVKALALAVDATAAAYGQGTFANRPVSTPAAPGVRGRFYYADDAQALYVDTGTAWVPAADLTAALTAMPKPGDLRFTARAALDVGWLQCNGASLLRADQPDLFAAIGVTYGAIDGAHFTLPDYHDRVPIGAGLGTVGRSPRVLGEVGGEEKHRLTTPELPGHAHATTEAAHSHGADGLTQGMGGANPHTHGMPMMKVLVAQAGPGVTQWAAAYVPPDTAGAGAAPLQQTESADVNHTHAIPYAKTGLTVNATGGDTAHENMQPFAVCNVWVKT